MTDISTLPAQYGFGPVIVIDCEALDYQTLMDETANPEDRWDAAYHLIDIGWDGEETMGCLLDVEALEANHMQAVYES